MYLDFICWQMNRQKNGFRGVAVKMRLCCKHPMLSLRVVWTSIPQFQNIHWASKETCHFKSLLQSDTHRLTKTHNIKINHIWAQISYKFSSWSTSEKSKGCFLSKRRKCIEIAKGNFSKTTETALWETPRKAAYSDHSIAIHSFSKAGYVTAELAIVRAELCDRRRRALSVIFFLMTSIDFTLCYSFFDSSKHSFFFLDVNLEIDRSWLINNEMNEEQ